MKYENITLKKYQVIKHIINKYAESHNDVTPNISYDKEAQILDISGISKPISFTTSSIGIIPEGAYEVVGQVIRSKTADGRVDKDGMNVYGSAQRIFNIANINKQEVFDFISENSRSSYCSCCGTNRERNKLFYIRRVDTSNKIYQVGSRCITHHFDTSYFDLMKELSNLIEHEGRASDYLASDYNLIDYLTLYCMFIKTTKNIKSCCKQVVEVLDNCEDVSETKWADSFNKNRSEHVDKILNIAKFYTDYPNYIRDDNMFIIKTVQSMAEMLRDNIDIDPYYSKSNCSNVSKMYLSLLSDYAIDYRKYTKDLFKYNAYLVETTLTDMWNESNTSPYKLNFNLDGRVFNITVLNNKSIPVKNIKIVVPLDNFGNMINESKSKSEMLDLLARINKATAVKSKKNDVIDILNKYKDECIARYSNFNPAIVLKHDASTIRFFDYANEPLVVNIIDDIEQSKVKLSTFINTLYVRQNLGNAYREFSKKYNGKPVMACMQPKQMNLQFSCEYIESQFKSNWPEDKVLSRISSHADTEGKNIKVYYNKSQSLLKFPVNSIGIVSGADYDITVRIKTFIAKELGLPDSFYKNIRPPKSAEDKLKNRPKKNVTRLFSSIGASASNLVSLRKINVLNDISGNTLGVSAKGIGKILVTIEDGIPICENDIYRGRISLDGHLVSDSKTFDKKTFKNAVHALEYLAYLSDDSNKLMCSIDILPTKRGKYYTYKHSVSLGNCTGVLQFRVVQENDKFILKYGPKFVVEKTLGEDKVSLAMHPNFNKECWEDIQQCILKLGDLQRGSEVIDGQKNNNLICGTMWINDGEPQQITNEMFTQVTGINI